MNQLKKKQSVQGVGGGGEDGVPAWSSNLNPVFKCLHMSAFGLDRTDEVPPLRKPSWAEPTFSQSSAPPLFHLLLSYYQWVRPCGKTGRGWKRESLTVVLTQHMCVCLKIVWRVNWGLFLLMRPRRRHIPASPEREQMPCSWGDSIVGCDSHSVCFFVCVYIKAR